MNYVSPEEFDRIKANQILRIALTKKLRRLKGSDYYRRMTLAQKLEACRAIETQINATF